jgi:MFS family permease
LNDGSTEAASPKHDPLAALRQPNFVLYTISRTFSSFGQTMFQAGMLWHVYDISHSAIDLGILGLFRFFPTLGLSLVGGAFADTYNRRTIILFAQIAPFFCGVVLAIATFGGWVGLELIYGLVVLLGLAAAFEGPARASLLPAIVRPETFANAVTVSNTVSQLAAVSGPALAGALIATASVGAVYAAYSILLVIALFALLALRYRPADSSESRRVSLTAIKEGLNYVRGHQVVLGSMSLDLFAVIFGGGATALLPIYAEDILGVGPGGYGVLATTMRIGTFAAAAFLLLLPPIRRAGRALVWSVIFFGIGTIVFGLSREYYLSLAAYAFLGAADQVSVVMRSTTIQLATPDELRGRVSAVNQVFVQASNQVGAMESGFLAAVTSATFAVVSGGVIAISVATAAGIWLRDLYNYVLPSGAAQPEDVHTGLPDREREPERVSR